MGIISEKKINKPVLGGREKVRVAAVQASQIVFNKEKSIEKACKMIKEAGANGADLVAFSETYIPVFPAYYTGGFESDMEEWALWNIGLQDNSIVVPSDDTEVIGNACREAGVYCVMGINELDDTEGSRSFYNTQILFGPDGKVIGRHRKTKPTYTERTYWSEGDGSDIKVYPTSIGRIGSLICWEHHTILVRAAQMLLGEELHIANWPGTWQFGKGEPGNKHGRFLSRNEFPMGERGDRCDLQFGIKEYAFQSGSFVISVSGLLREEDFEPQYKSLINSDHMNFEWAIGGAAIVNPFGEYLAGPVLNDETIVYADCYANEIKAAKAVFDGLGHYSRPDIAKLLLNSTHYQNLVYSGSDSKLSSEYAYLKEVSEKFEIDLARLEKLAGKMENEAGE